MIAAESDLDLLLRHDPDVLNQLNGQQARRLRYDWDMNRRPAQAIPDGMGSQYRAWILRAGRGFGKTRTGAETTRKMIERVERIALVAPTAGDIRDVMIEGESGLMSVFPSDQRPVYIGSLRRLNFYNGAFAITYSGEEPERLRGPQHEWAWIDEPASIRRGDQVLSNLLLGLRLGVSPWLLITGTPKPVRWLRQLSDEPTTYTTTGTTYDNARNLSAAFIEDIRNRYEGTRLGRQELYAEFLDDVEGALWTETMINEARMSSFDTARPWESLNSWLTGKGLPARADRRPWRTVVAVDPPGETAECGIVVAAAPVNAQGGIDHAVVLDDMSMAGRPEAWGAQVAAAARKWNAERVIVETNQGGDMTRATIAAVDPTIRVEKIHAKGSKYARAEPVSAQYERRFVHHAGFFPLLEQQMTTWVSSEGKSPDRIDALVHAISSLLPPRLQIPASVRSVANRRIPG
jgi:phage terminase large subunit-like protein